MRATKFILLSTAAAMIASPALAADDAKVIQVKNTLDTIFLEEVDDTVHVDLIDSISTKFEIDQINKGDITASTATWTNRVGYMSATAVAIANNASVDVKGNAGGSNWQGNWGDVTAYTNADVSNAYDGAEITAVAIGNNFSLNVEEYGGAVFSSKQVNDGDITASTKVGAYGEIGHLTSSAVAIANNASVQIPHGGSLVGGVAQTNNGHVTAYNSTTLKPHYTKAADATAVAIGNNVSISNYVPTVK